MSISISSALVALPTEAVVLVIIVLVTAGVVLVAAEVVVVVIVVVAGKNCLFGQLIISLIIS